MGWWEDWPEYEPDEEPEVSVGQLLAEADEAADRLAQYLQGR